MIPKDDIKLKGDEEFSELYDILQEWNVGRTGARLPFPMAVVVAANFREGCIVATKRVGERTFATSVFQPKVM